jgi:hypothetical protein
VIPRKKLLETKQGEVVVGGGRKCKWAVEGNGFILVSECLPGIILVRLLRSYAKEGSNLNKRH